MTERDEPSGNEQRRMGKLVMDGGIQRPERRHNGRNGAAGMVLDPLAEIGGGMFMPVIVRRGEDMVYFQRRGKRRKND